MTIAVHTHITDGASEVTSTSTRVSCHTGGCACSTILTRSTGTRVGQCCKQAQNCEWQTYFLIIQ